MALIRAVATVGGLTLLSRVAGFVRDILTAALLGAGPVADAFFVALKLPNLFRRLFAEGAFSVSFVPVFNAELERDGRDSALVFAERALAVMVTVLLPFTVLALAFMPQVIAVIAPGFADEPERLDYAVAFSRVTFPYLLMMALVALMGGVLNSFDRFAPFAAAPILFNATLIAALLGLTPVMATPGHALSWGVAAAGAVQLVFLARACAREGVRLRLVAPSLSPRIRRLFRLMGPAALGTGVQQINSFVDILLASLLPAGAISWLYYADRLYQMPLGVVGIALSTALLPMLSRQVQHADPAEARASLNRAIEVGLLLGLPAGAALMAMPGPVLSVLFERGAFTAADSQATAMALFFFAAGIPAYVLVKVLATGFFARQDTTRPVQIAATCAALNMALGALAVWLLPKTVGHAGLAAATAATGWLNAGLLARGLIRREHLVADARLRRRLPRLAIAAAVMAGALVAGTVAARPWLDGTLAYRATALLALVGGGALVYFALAQAIGAIRLGELKRLLTRRDGGSAAPAAAGGGDPA